MEIIIENIWIDSKGCWIWQKSTNSDGYGQTTIDGKYWTTHRWSYTKHYGSIPSDKIVRHMCHNTRCCNPYHLTLGTDKDNYHDSKELHEMVAKSRRKTWCVDGIFYPTCRSVVDEFGISASTVIKYTRDGIFDVKAYRAACIIACVTPKI